MATLVVWDVDGTLTESKPGIFASYKYAARQSGIPEPTDEVLERMCCGGLLGHIFQIFGKTGEEADVLAKDYRWYYSNVCSEKVQLFYGVREVLAELHEKGFVQAVATMNNEEGAARLLGRLGIADYFVRIAGADAEDRRTKTDMILDCVSTGDYDRVVMIGDCPGDRKAADEEGVEFLAAAFGYGYPEVQCVREKLPHVLNPGDIIRVLNP